MSANNVSFVEWKEEFVSSQRGSRVVHYILKDSSGESVLAVVGTERSLRHMVYIVADEFLNYFGAESPVQAGFKWRSRREVVDWLKSMLCKKQLQGDPSDVPRGSPALSLGYSEFSLARFSCQPINAVDKKDHCTKNSIRSYSDIAWVGAPWACGKQLKHFPAFCRNGTTIRSQSFVFVMAKEDNRYLAYLEDMYEDKKGQKKVKVRWFHHSQEVKGVVRLQNAHPKEVYITTYTQVISAECVDGPAVVLTREHFERCIDCLPDIYLAQIHLCFRQFRNNKIKPFDLRKLRGYFDQPIISCLESNYITNHDTSCCGGDEVKALSLRENGVHGTKRTRNYDGLESLLTVLSGANGHMRKKVMYAPLCHNVNYALYDRRLPSLKNIGCRSWHSQVFKVEETIELLCQDSGIRGCWFSCSVLEVSRKRIKVQYNDVEDQDGCGKLEEWVSAFRMAAPDKLDMRHLDRPTIRPIASTSDMADHSFAIGDPVDAWWSDGWWEGVIFGANTGEHGNLQVYIPGENLFLDVSRNNLRVSRDWVGGQWVDVKAKPDILSIISAVVSPDTKLSEVSTLAKADKSDGSALETRVNNNENKVVGSTSVGPCDVQVGQVSSEHKGEKDNGVRASENSDSESMKDTCNDGDGDDNIVGGGETSV